MQNLTNLNQREDGTIALRVPKGLVLGTSDSPFNTVSLGTVKGFELYLKGSGAYGDYRGLESQVEYSGTNSGGTAVIYGVRGVAIVSGSITGASYAYGTIGRMYLSGTVGASARVAAVQAKISGSPTVEAGGEIMGLWVDLGAISTKDAGILRMVSIQNTNQNLVPNAVFHIYGRAEQLFEIRGNGLGHGSTVCNDYIDRYDVPCGATTGALKFTFLGTQYYIPITTNATA
jgi:hypothetical protein